jgi:hypothetical protein
MDLTNFAGKVAIGISVAIVLVFIALIALAVFCIGLGAVSSVTNPHAAQDAAIEIQNATSQINTGAADIVHAVPTMPGK